MSRIIDAIEKEQLKTDVTDFKVGDLVGYVVTLGAYAAERLLPADRAVKLPDKISCPLEFSNTPGKNDVSENRARVMLRNSMIGNLASLAEKARDSWERENTRLRPPRSML